jgi:hypothetical protein
VALKEMWGKLGVTLELDPLDRATATQRYRANQFQVYVTSWTNDIPDPSQLVAYALGFTESQSYHSGYQSAEMDGLLARGLREVNLEKRRQIYYEIQELALKDSPLIWLYYAPYTIAINKKMKGFVQLAMHRERWPDQLVRVLITLPLASPAFWIGILLLILCALKLGWFPATGYGEGFVGHLGRLFLPGLTLSHAFAAVLTRNLRSALIDVRNTAYVDFARAKGLDRRRVWLRHVLRPALLPIVTLRPGGWSSRVATSCGFPTPTRRSTRGSAWAAPCGRSWTSTASTRPVLGLRARSGSSDRWGLLPSTRRSTPASSRGVSLSGSASRGRWPSSRSSSSRTSRSRRWTSRSRPRSSSSCWTCAPRSGSR